MPIDRPTDDDCLRLAADLRHRTRPVRENGWATANPLGLPGSVLGVASTARRARDRRRRRDVGAALRGIADAEVDTAAGCEQTRWWFTSNANPLPMHLNPEDRTGWEAATAAMRDALT